MPDDNRDGSPVFIAHIGACERGPICKGPTFHNADELDAWIDGHAVKQLGPGQVRK